MHKINYKTEILRKFIHLSSSLIPISILIFDINICKILLPILAFTFILFEYLRLKYAFIRRIYNAMFSSVVRSNELNILTGGSYVFLSAAICVNIFTPNIAVISLLILSISDTMAALFGITFGKTNFFDKTLEGSLAFFISSLVIVYYFDTPLIIGLFVCIISTIVESIKMKHLNDNIAVPITVGVILTFGALL